MSNYDKITDEQLVEIQKLLNMGMSVRSIARDILGNEKRESTLRHKISIGLLNRSLGAKATEDSDKPVVSGSLHCPTRLRGSFSGKRFVFTSAQNNTYVHEKFLRSLEQYCSINDAELVVGTYKYNTNGFQNNSKDDIWYDPKIRDYINNESLGIAEGLLWCGELNILPTAVNPIAGLHNYTNRDSGIIPHAKVQLESLPTPKHEPARMLYTTGTVTQRNYVDMKAGQKAAHHHVFGALVVEVDADGEWFVRQLVSETESGCFFDLEYYYTPDGLGFNGEPCSVEAINWGDIHQAKIDDVVAAASWGDEGCMMDMLQPEHVFLHDVLDQARRNHHNIKDPYFRFMMQQGNTECVKEEVEQTAELIASMNGRGTKVVVVESNHDLALQKWLKEQDYRYDPVNAVFFLELQLATYEAMRDKKPFSVFEYACRQTTEGLEGVSFLKTDESYTICGDIECGSHSHLGNNGARGTVRAYQMQGARFNIGHSHSSTIKDGVYQAGVSGCLDMGYNSGGSSWNQSHIVTYSNGKRAIVTLKNGKWRAIN